MEESVKSDYHKIIIAGPTRVGKSTTLDMLEDIRSDIERGTKYKYRFVGGPWPDDNQKKDSLIVKSQEELDELRRSGKTAFEYATADTRHLVGNEDALRTDKHIVYISDSHYGAMRFKQFFRHLPQYSKDPITFLFYTNPDLIKTRLRSANIPDEQIEIRLKDFEKEVALFQQHSSDYLFLISVRYPPIDSSIVLDEASKEMKREEIKAEVERVALLIDNYGKIFSPGMNYECIHNTHVNTVSQELVGNNLVDLEGRLADGDIVKIDLREQIEQYRKDRYVPRETLEAVNNVVVQSYFYDNGRHSILLRGIVDPWAEPSHLPEDIVLGLIKSKLGEPTQERTIKNQNYSKHSDLGFFKIENGGFVKEGAVYSLGDQLVDDKHTSLHIGYLYTKGQPIRITGYTLGDLHRLGMSFI